MPVDVETGNISKRTRARAHLPALRRGKRIAATVFPEGCLNIGWNNYQYLSTRRARARVFIKVDV